MAKVVFSSGTVASCITDSLMPLLLKHKWTKAVHNFIGDIVPIYRGIQYIGLMHKKKHLH